MHAGGMGPFLGVLLRVGIVACAVSLAACSSSDSGSTPGGGGASAQQLEVDECCVLRRLCNAGCDCSAVQVEAAVNGTTDACADVSHSGCAQMSRDDALTECSADVKPEGPGSSCTPGEVVACDCPGGSPGTAVCGSDGALEQCSCEPVLSQEQACLEMNEVLCGELVGCGFESSFTNCVELMPTCDPTVDVPETLLQQCKDGLYAQSCAEFELIIMPIECDDILRL